MSRLGAWIAGCWARLFPPRTLGQKGERAACRFLRRRGCKILARGYRTPLGEIDLVALDGRTIVFVEVKTRQNAALGNPADAVDDDKQRRLTRLAVAFLKRYRLLDRPARFDVVAVAWPEGKRRPEIQHYVSAFEAVGWNSFFS